MHTQTLSQVENTNQSSLRYSKSINTKPKKAKGSNPDLQAIYEGILKHHRSNPNALQALYDINVNPRKPSKNRMTSIADNKENNTSAGKKVKNSYALQALYDKKLKPHRSNPNRMTSIADNKENNTSAGKKVKNSYALQALYDINGNPRKPSKNRMTSIADEHCPCDTCESAYLCADIKMACVDFNQYLSDGKFHNKDRQLSREMYIKIYPTDPLSRAVQM